MWPWASSPAPSVLKGGGLAHVELKASWSWSYLNQDKKTRRLCMAPTLPATEALSVGGPSLPPPAPEGWPAPTSCLPWPLAFGCRLGEQTLPDAFCPHFPHNTARLGGRAHPAALPMGALAPWEQIPTFLCGLRPPPNFSKPQTVCVHRGSWGHLPG